MMRSWGFVVTMQVAACGAAPPESSDCGPEQGTVQRVIDGDTVVLDDETRVRYLLVDTPETVKRSHPGPGEPPYVYDSSECYGPEATDRNIELVDGREVRLEYDVECMDKYDRLLAYVYVGDNMVNRALVAGGFGEVLVIPPNGRHAEDFYAAETDARNRQAGLWGVCP